MVFRNQKAIFCGTIDVKDEKYRKGEDVGFLCLKETGKETVEQAVMGVLEEYHRRGLGRQLFSGDICCQGSQIYECMFHGGLVE